ncbi:MAG TPA: ATP synthase F1 subunit epsilon [Planctomycetota bacterium]|nr:ATP synthase F1 subunit epsilon [Planctomycetota bacterium]
MSAPRPLRLHVLTPERTVVDAEVASVRVPVHDGSIGILARHAPLVAPVGIGILSLRKPGGAVEEIFVNEGFVEVRDNVVRVVSETGERSDEIDLARAKEAEARARERIASRVKVDVDLDRAERALLRSIARQRLAERRARRS